MRTIIDIITYDYKHYEEADFEGKLEIESLAAKLKPLEHEIMNDPKGEISIMKTGNIFSNSFNTELADKITKIITGY